MQAARRWWVSSSSYGKGNGKQPFLSLALACLFLHQAAPTAFGGSCAKF